MKDAAPAKGMPQGALLALVLLTSLNLFNYIDRFILPGVQTLVQSEFRINDEKIGELTTAFFVVYMLTAPLTGWMGDRFRRKPLIVAGALLWSALTLTTGLVHSYRELYVRHALVGIGEASFGIFAPALIADYFPETARNRVLSWFYIAIPVGAALGYAIGGVLGGHYGWRVPFYVSAIPGALIALCILFFMREPERGATERVATPRNGATFAGMFVGLFKNPAYLTATFGMVLLTFSMGGISVYMPTFLHRFAGYSVSKAGLVMGASLALCGLVATGVGGWLAQRWLQRNNGALYLLSAWSLLLCIPFGMLAFYGTAKWIVPAIVVAIFFLFLNTGPLNAAIVNSVTAKIRATAIALELLLIHLLGDAVSPKLIGRISDASSLRNGLAITLVSMLAGGLLLLWGSRFAPELDREVAMTPAGT
ncbi:MAG TPA: MFS transporter [Acidobacteriaceae bacterium]|jgi:MFS family permease|nr:MFS transporter [Acidobacteriaceae bacterium]